MMYLEALLFILLTYINKIETVSGAAVLSPTSQEYRTLFLRLYESDWSIMRDTSPPVSLEINALAVSMSSKKQVLVET